MEGKIIYIEIECLNMIGNLIKKYNEKLKLEMEVKFKIVVV